jgi:hypothetical protein
MPEKAEKRPDRSFVVPPLGGNCGWRPAKAGTTNDFAILLMMQICKSLSFSDILA